MEEKTTLLKAAVIFFVLSMVVSLLKMMDIKLFTLMGYNLSWIIPVAAGFIYYSANATVYSEDEYALSYEQKERRKEQASEVESNEFVEEPVAHPAAGIIPEANVLPQSEVKFRQAQAEAQKQAQAVSQPVPTAAQPQSKAKAVEAPPAATEMPAPPSEEREVPTEEIYQDFSTHKKSAEPTYKTTNEPFYRADGIDVPEAPEEYPVL